MNPELMKKGLFKIDEKHQIFNMPIRVRFENCPRKESVKSYFKMVHGLILIKYELRFDPFNGTKKWLVLWTEDGSIYFKTHQNSGFLKVG